LTARRRPGERTRPNHPNAALRGRRYAIPFDRVWAAALKLIEEGGSRWVILEANDQAGFIRAEAETFLFRFVDDVLVQIGLDVDAQTRVDVTSRSRKGKTDLGTNGRRIRKFLRALDGALDVRPELVLPPEDGLPVTFPE
jgi:hypothetical protein